MYDVGNGVLGVEVFNKSEAIEEALFELQCTKEYENLQKEYWETGNKNIRDKMWAMEREFLKKRGFYN